MGVLTTYRAWLLRAVGDYQMRVHDQVRNCSDADTAPLDELGAAFDRQVDVLLKRLWDDLVRLSIPSSKLSVLHFCYCFGTTW